jgi:hypothetical protein
MNVDSLVADQAHHMSSSRRSRQAIFRLLLRQFGAMIGETGNGHHPSPASVLRVTVESWLRCQGLIVVRQSQKEDVSTTFQTNGFTF